MERDFRVKAFLYIKNETRALDLYDHVLNVKDKAVDINAESPNAETRLVEIGGNYVVVYDLCFPPDKQGQALGLFYHSKNLPGVTKLPNPDKEEETGFAEIHRCGHRTGQSCPPELTERYKVT